jgi:Zn-dependent peptidase ImmA (M78 family)
MNAEAEGRDAAIEFRLAHRLGVQPLGDLVAVIEQATGVDVAVLDAGPDEHGLTVRDPVRDVVFIGVARTNRPMRQRSTLAHELGHVLFGDRVDPHANNLADRTPTETRADAFARHLLVPAEGVRDLVGQAPATTAVLSSIVQRFLVSPQIAAIALRHVGLIDAETKRQWMTISTSQLAARFGWTDQYHALQTDSNRRRAPQRLLARAIRGYEEGVLSAQAIATLRGISLTEAEADLHEADIRPLQRPTTWTDPADLGAPHVDLAALDEALATGESELPGTEDHG